LLLGFFCELDGSSEITLDETELAMAEWVDRDQLPENNDHSLTREMMSILRENGELDYRKI
jgi:NAD+ diphosphatase